MGSLITQEKDNPIDTLLLAIFNGQVDPKMIGPPFPTVEELSTHYKVLMTTNPIESLQANRAGSWIITLL